MIFLCARVRAHVEEAATIGMEFGQQGELLGPVFLQVLSSLYVAVFTMHSPTLQVNGQSWITRAGENHPYTTMFLTFRVRGPPYLHFSLHPLQYNGLHALVCDVGDLEHLPEAVRINSTRHRKELLCKHTRLVVRK